MSLRNKVFSEKVLKQLERSKESLNIKGKCLLEIFVNSYGSEVDDENNICYGIIRKADVLANKYPVPDIRFINFDDLKAFGTFPRYPDNKELTHSINSIDRDNSLFIFISHCWMRGHEATEGWDGKPHPDNVEGDKFKLCVQGIEKIKNTYAPRMKDCYVWLDYGCMNQDDKYKVAYDLERYDKVMKCCDAVFTPIVDREHKEWDYPGAMTNVLEDYKAKLWNDGPDAYLNRGWCRIEMLYAAHIPVQQNRNTDIQRHTMFEAGLAHHCSQDWRPHFIYGNKEDTCFDALILPPLRHSYLTNYHPTEGNFSIPSDLDIIEALIEDLKPYIDKNKINVGYRGARNEKGERHGYGVYLSMNGKMYEGEWVNDAPHGRGTMTFMRGDTYEGDWFEGMMHGEGVYRYTAGHVYVGQFDCDLRAGRGRLTFPNKAWFEGDYFNGKRHGNGTYHSVDGCSYVGQFINGEWCGHVVCTDAGGNVSLLESDIFPKIVYVTENGKLD